MAKNLNVVKLNVISLNVLSLNSIDNTGNLRKQDGNGEPVAWLWDNDSELLWDNNEEILIKK